MKTPRLRPQLGDIVEFTHIMRREDRRFPNANNDWIKEWVPHKAHKPTRGIYLGPRVLQVGFVVYGDYDTPTEWHQTGTTTVALVCTGPRKNPIYVDPENMRVLQRMSYANRTLLKEGQ